MSVTGGGRPAQARAGRVSMAIAIILATIASIVGASALSPTTALAETASGTCGTCSWVIDDDGCLTISPTNGSSGTLANNTLSTEEYKFWSWYSNQESVTSVVISPGVSTSKHSTFLFSGMSNATSMDVANLVVTGDISYMFSGCSSLTTLDVSNWSTGSVTNMSNMFSDCSKLSSLTLGANFRFGPSGTQTTAASLPDAPTTSPYTGKWVLSTDASTARSLPAPGQTPRCRRGWRGAWRRATTGSGDRGAIMT